MSAIAALSLIGTVPAQATKYTYVVTGIVSSAVVDDFSPDPPPFAAGEAFTATMTVDDATPDAFYNAGPTWTSADGGGLFQDGTHPPVTASLTVGGYSFAVPQGDYIDAVLDPSGDPIGTYTVVRDLGHVDKDVATRTVTASAEYKSAAYCCNGFPGIQTIDTDRLGFSLVAPDFTSDNYRETGTFALLGMSTGAFLVDHHILTSSGDDFDSFLSATFAPSLLTVTSDAVPEPATWMLALIGLGASGAMLRKSRRPASVRLPTGSLHHG